MQREENKLDHLSSFEALAQYAIEKYYLIPYPNRPDKRPNNINRIFHGGVHVSSTVNNLEVCLQLYMRYAPHLLTIDGKPLSDEEIKLLKLAAIYHDVANVNDAHGSGEEHAKIFIRDMLALGFTPEFVHSIGHAIMSKDESSGQRIVSIAEKIKSVNRKNIYQKLLQSSDCIDVIRVVRKLFDINQLDLFHDLKSHTGFEPELRELLEKQTEFLDHFNLVNGDVSEVHRLCESSPNCYLIIKRFYENYDQVRNNSISAIELVKKIIREQTLEATSIPEAYKDGIIVRMIEDINNEMKIVKENIKILEQQQLTSLESFKQYLTEQEKAYTQVFTPPDFKWRPATLIKAGIPIPLYGNKSEKQRAFIIILPNDPNTKSVFLYKKNVISNATRSGNFMYSRTTFGRAKNKGDIRTLSLKLEEMNNRRIGLQPDPGLHYFGKPNIEMGEVLLSSYEPAGIGVAGFDKISAENAIRISKEYNVQNLKFYRYLPETGLHEISYEEVLAQARGELQPPRNDENIYKDIEQQLNTHPELIQQVKKTSLMTSAGQVIAFEFATPEAQCIAYVKDGFPIIDLHYNTGAKITVNAPTLLPLVAEKYYREKLAQLVEANKDNTLYQFEMHKKNNKLLFTVKLNVSPTINQYDHTKLIDKLKEFSNFTVNKFPANPNQLEFSTANLELIEALRPADSMNKFMSITIEYLNEGNFEEKKPMEKKILGSKYPPPSKDKPSPQKIRPAVGSSSLERKHVSTSDFEKEGDAIEEEFKRRKQLHSESTVVRNIPGSITSSSRQAYTNIFNEALKKSKQHPSEAIAQKAYADNGEDTMTHMERPALGKDAFLQVGRAAANEKMTLAKMGRAVHGEDAVNRPDMIHKLNVAYNVVPNNYYFITKEIHPYKDFLVMSIYFIKNLDLRQPSPEIERECFDLDDTSEEQAVELIKNKYQLKNLKRLSSSVSNYTEDPSPQKGPN